MRLGKKAGGRSPLNVLRFAPYTLLAWGATAFLYVLIRAPLTRGAPLITYSALLISLLPWLSGLVFWAKLRKRTKLGTVDPAAAGFCSKVIFNALGSAYLAVLSVEILLLWVLIRAK